MRHVLILSLLGSSAALHAQPVVGQAPSTEQTSTAAEIATDGAMAAADEQKPDPVCAQGIYLMRDPSNPASAEQISMVLTDGRKMGGLGGFMLTGGLAGGLKVKTVVKGIAAPVRVSTATPVFRLCFDPPPEQSATQDEGTGTAYVGARKSPLSPRDYTLVRFETKNKKNRELTIGKTSMAGASGAVSDSAIRVRITEISETMFEVTPQTPLQPGEYGFIRPVGGGAIAMPARNAMEQVFDFGVDGAKPGK